MPTTPALPEQNLHAEDFALLLDSWVGPGALIRLYGDRVTLEDCGTVKSPTQVGRGLRPRRCSGRVGHAAYLEGV
jgi:hypothetical protein